MIANERYTFYKKKNNEVIRGTFLKYLSENGKCNQRLVIKTDDILCLSTPISFMKKITFFKFPNLNEDVSRYINCFI